jgi:hypothetical protein
MNVLLRATAHSDHAVARRALVALRRTFMRKDFRCRRRSADAADLAMHL